MVTGENGADGSVVSVEETRAEYAGVTIPNQEMVAKNVLASSLTIDLVLMKDVLLVRLQSL